MAPELQLVFRNINSERKMREPCKDRIRYLLAALETMRPTKIHETNKTLLIMVRVTQYSAGYFYL